MRSFFLHIILFLYTASVVRPVLPVMVDLLAHTFQELEHTNTVHAHKGEQHVHLEMQSRVTDQKEDSSAPKIEVSVTPHIISNVEISFFAGESGLPTWGRAIHILAVTYLSMPSPPPKC